MHVSPACPRFRNHVLSPLHPFLLLLRQHALLSTPTHAYAYAYAYTPTTHALPVHSTSFACFCSPLRLHRTRIVACPLRPCSLIPPTCTTCVSVAREPQSLLPEPRPLRFVHPCEDPSTLVRLTLHRHVLPRLGYMATWLHILYHRPPDSCKPSTLTCPVALRPGDAPGASYTRIKCTDASLLLEPCPGRAQRCTAVTLVSYK